MWAAGGGRARGAAGHASIHRRQRGRVRAPSQKATAARAASVRREANIKSTACCSNSLAGGSDVPGNEAINLVPVLCCATRRCSAASGVQLPCAEWGLPLPAGEEAALGSPPSPITRTRLLAERARRSGQAAGTNLRARGAPGAFPSRPGLCRCPEEAPGTSQPASPRPGDQRPRPQLHPPARPPPPRPRTAPPTAGGPLPRPARRPPPRPGPALRPRRAVGRSVRLSVCAAAERVCPSVRGARARRSSQDPRLAPAVTARYWAEEQQSAFCRHPGPSRGLLPGCVPRADCSVAVRLPNSLCLLLVKIH